MTDTWGTGGLTIVECLRPLGCPTKQTKQKKKKKKKQICFNDKNIKTLKDVRLITFFLMSLSDLKLRKNVKRYEE